MSVHKKLMEARIRLAQSDLKKTGENKFAGYKYFELGDFLPSAQAIFADLGLCGIVSFTAELATLTITDTETNSWLTITSPMGSAALKGCHEVQNIGAVETYQRRYLWVSAFEIVEHDALDATTGKVPVTPAASVSKIGPSAGVLESLSEERQAAVRDIAAMAQEYLDADDLQGAMEYLRERSGLEGAEEQVAVSTLFKSYERAAMKKAKDGDMAAATEYLIRNRQRKAA